MADRGIAWRRPNHDENDMRLTAPYSWAGWLTVYGRRWQWTPPWGCTNWALPRVRYCRGGDENCNNTLLIQLPLLGHVVLWKPWGKLRTTPCDECMAEDAVPQFEGLLESPSYTARPPAMLQSISDMLASAERGPRLRELRCMKLVSDYLAIKLPRGNATPYAMLTGVPVLVDEEIPVGKMRLVYDDGTTRDIVIFNEADTEAVEELASILRP